MPVRRSADKELAFFFTAYGDRARHTHRPPRVAVAGPSRVRRRRSSIDALDRQGRVPHLQRIPIDTLPEGVYELRVSVSDGARQ